MKAEAGEMKTGYVPIERVAEWFDVSSEVVGGVSRDNLHRRIELQQAEARRTTEQWMENYLSDALGT